MPQLSCIVCGADFHIPPNRATTARFCSVACKNKGGKRREAMKRLDLTCPYCGNGFSRYPSELFRYKAHYCSTRCHNKARLKLPTTNPSMVDWIWLAGFIDGEGTFSAMPGFKGKHRPFFCISSTDQEIIKHIGTMLGGGWYITQWRNKKWKPACRLTVTAPALLQWLIQGVPLKPAPVINSNFLTFFGPQPQQ